MKCLFNKVSSLPTSWLCALATCLCLLAFAGSEAISRATSGSRPVRCRICGADVMERGDFRSCPNCKLFSSKSMDEQTGE